ncbi:hypothetical protein JNM87_06160 [Candidatus Saccharibacteria bacterium]|nr:hypothetical protein [Candidatus Saccharibacteria bacterium]
MTDIRLIDQIYFDPNKDFEDYQLQLVGLGWIIGIDAKSFSMEIVYS